jgi:hypothetical protein
MENQDVLTPEPKLETKELAEVRPEAKYPHLHLADWPFQTVPDERFTKIWADRRSVLEVVYQLLNGLSRKKPSTINLIWAWYGTGKSHTLKHMVHLCHEKFKTLLPVYTEYPKTVKSFLDLYVYFISELGVDFIADVGIDLLSSKDSVGIKRSLLKISSDFVAALELLLNDELLAKRYLMAEKLSRLTLSKHGISKRIETSDDAVKIAACIIKMLELSGRCSRVIWMIDEFQRIGSERTAISEDINTGLHSVFNACPNSFSLFLSFSVREKEKMFKHLSRELIDRIGIQKILEIPKMTSQDAFTFISDLLYEFRPDVDSAPSAFYPFEDDVVKYIIALIEQSNDLKPRSIMQYFNCVLEAADGLIASGNMKSIDIEFAKKTLGAHELFVSARNEMMVERA